MKYPTEITVNLPREQTIALFDDPQNLPKWQEGLKSFELISGEAGQPGAKSLLIYDMKGRRTEMVETILERSLPDRFSGTYEAKGVWNMVDNRFYEDGPDRTRWVLETEFKFSGLMVIMALLMRRSFAKRTLEDMNRFKEFAESATSPS